MELWMIILGALTGGLLILQGFGKAKAGSEQLLDIYQDMLDDAARREREKGEVEEHEFENDSPA